MRRFMLVALVLGASTLLALGVLAIPDMRAAGVTGRGGFDAVAVSVDGKWVAVGGQNRVVYILAGDTLEVKKRFWLGSRVGNLAFSRDASRLLIEDETDTLHFFDVAQAKVLSKQPSQSHMVADASGEWVILSDNSDQTRPRLRRVSTAKLEELGRIELEDRAAAYNLDGTGKRLVVLSVSRNGAEKRVPSNEVPRELTGLARWTFRLKYDGLIATLWTVDLATNKIVQLSNLWYTSDSETTVVVPAGKTTYVLNRVNLNARIVGNQIDMFETGERMNHAIGVSPDCKTLVLGGIGTGSQGPVEGKRVRFDLPALPGQGEMFTRFAVRGDGSAYGVTTASRLIHLDRAAKIDKVVPVY